MPCKTLKTRRNGMAIMLALTLLAVIAMLVTTFLLTCRLEARYADAAAIINIPERLALSATRQVENLLVDDLYICDEGNTYGAILATASGPDAWRRYTDYPSDEDEGCDGILSAFEAEKGTWTHITRIHGARAGNTNGIAIDPDSRKYIDTDGDGKSDSYLGQPDKVTDFRNRDYDVAARVIDLSGLVCVNTAVAPEPDLEPPVSPNHVHLGVPAGCHEKITNDKTGFHPEEEPHLRWLEMENPCRIGRFYIATKEADNSPLDAEIRRYLTTRSDVTSALRNPSIEQKLRINPDRIPAQPGLVRDILFGSCYKTGIRKNIVHFLANAMAYIDGRKQDEKYELALPDGGTAYGIVPQPVISEAYVTATFNDEGEITYSTCGVEIFNPFGVNLAPYRLVCGDSEFDIPEGSPGWSVILSNQDGEKLPPGDIFSSLDLAGETPVRLVRRVGETDIPADVISIPAGKYPAASGASTIETTASRDTNPGRMRFLVGIEHVKTDEKPGIIHTLGDSNNLGEDDIDCLEGFHISSRISDLPELLNIGELLGLHAVGPDGNESLPEKLACFARRFSRGKADFLNESPGLCNSGTYPDIPWPLLVGEIFDKDPRPVVRGRININTAPKEVLRRLPWPEEITIPPLDLDRDGDPELEGFSHEIDMDKIVGAIIAFRNNPATGHRGSECAGMKGFLTPSELIIPLEKYTRSILNQNHVLYPLARHLLYSSVGNVISTNSSTFAAYITVRKKISDSRTRQWHYLDVIDRSVCSKPGALPRSFFFRLGCRTTPPAEE